MPTPSPLAALVCVGLAGPTLDDNIRRLLDRGVAGIILFARNVESPEQVAILTRDLKQYAGRPLLIMTDQEGGPTARLRDGFTPLPSMRALGQTRDASLARQVGAIIGTELRAVGIDMALAPVLDVDTNPANPVIGSRSFGPDPATVATMGCALIAGIQSAGVAACAKHFPGHGDTAQDSHLALPHLPHAMNRLEQVELPPFRAAAKAGVAAVMSAHIVFDAIDPARPATMSPAVLQGVLRESIGFDGVLISDCMEMKAIADPDNLGGDGPPIQHVPAAVIAGIVAGLDLTLISHSPALAHAAIDALERAADTGTLSATRIAEATHRVEMLLQTYVQPALDQPDLAALNTPDSNAATRPILGDHGSQALDPTETLARD